MATRWIGPETGEETRFALIVLLLLAFAISVGGCGKSPPQDPEMYDRERLALKPASKTEKYLPDRIPWQVKESSISGVLDRLKEADSRLEKEMREIDQTVHGQCRISPPLPDRCPRIPYCTYGISVGTTGGSAVGCSCRRSGCSCSR
ncbi:MAG: hypothetical protein WA705_25050 [Candidatus Ozemobacteraceae bacterium]